MICNNCGANAEGKYCNQCGQKLGIGRVTTHELMHDAWHGITHTDKGIFKLLKDIVLRPRSFYRNYFGGQRKMYFSPVVFFLLTAGLMVYLYPYVFDYEDKVTGRFNTFGRELFHLTKFRALLLLPVQVGITWLFYRKRFNLGEIIFFWLFTMGLIYSYRLITIPLYFPLIHFKGNLDDFFTISSYLIMLWQGLMLMDRIRWKDVLFWLVIVNVAYMADFFIQIYLVFGPHIFEENTYGWNSVWDIIKARYSL